MKFTFESNMKGKGDCGKCPLCYIVPFQPTYGKLCILTQKMIALEDFKCPLEESESYENKATSTNAGVEVDYPSQFVRTKQGTFMGHPCNFVIWHRYPEEMPNEIGDYLVTIRWKIAKGETYLTVGNASWMGYGWDMLDTEILAWSELPEPYKETT